MQPWSLIQAWLPPKVNLASHSGCPMPRDADVSHEQPLRVLRNALTVPWWGNLPCLGPWRSREGHGSTVRGVGELGEGECRQQPALDQQKFASPLLGFSDYTPPALGNAERNNNTPWLASELPGG